MSAWPCPCCGASWFAQHFSWCVEPEQKRCPCGVLHCEEKAECPICQLEADRERRRPIVAAVQR